MSDDKAENRETDSLEFVYKQLLELVKREESIRDRLESKANTYIGFLSIAVTILFTIDKLITEKYSSIGLSLSEKDTSIILLYFLIQMAFIIGIIFAFKAYHTGSKNIIKKYKRKEKLLFNWNGSDNSIKNINKILAKEYHEKWINKADVDIKDNNIVISDNLGNILKMEIDSSKTKVKLNINGTIYTNLKVRKEDSNIKVYCQINDVYLKMGVHWLVENSSENKDYLYSMLIPHLQDIYSVNHQFNLKKSNNILVAYYCTLFSIVLILFTSTVNLILTI